MTVFDFLTLTSIPPEDEALRAPVRVFLTVAMHKVPARIRAKYWSGCNADFSRALARRGWLGTTLPVEYSGGGCSAFARYLLVEVAAFRDLLEAHCRPSVVRAIEADGIN